MRADLKDGLARLGLATDVAFSIVFVPAIATLVVGTALLAWMGLDPFECLAYATMLLPFGVAVGAVVLATETARFLAFRRPLSARFAAACGALYGTASALALCTLMLRRDVASLGSYVVADEAFLVLAFGLPAGVGSALCVRAYVAARVRRFRATSPPGSAVPAT